MRNCLIIRGGNVFDPKNEVDGEKKDILISDGKIVEELNSRDAKTIDASHCIIMPGGVDLHSHIAGSKINMGRLLRPEDHRGYSYVKTSKLRSGVGYSCPSTFTTGYLYAKLGYTTVFEPAMSPLVGKHVHEELYDTPIIDKGAFVLCGNNHFTLKYVREGNIEKLKAFIIWLLKTSKAYGVKVVNPGGVENWKWGKNCRSLDDPVKNYDVTPREILTELIRANEELGFPPVHLHCNNLGLPGNYRTTLSTMEIAEQIKSNGSRKNNLHIGHCQFNALAGENWAKVRSGAPEIAEHVNGHKNITMDIGQVIFTDTTTMTGDGPWQFTLWNMTGNKWVNKDVELESGAGIVPYTFKKANGANSVQWGIGIELALLIKDPWRVYLTTDHPNGGPFVHYPEVVAWLMSRKARTDMMNEINQTCFRRTDLANNYREYTFGEIAIISRSGTAQVLGLTEKGHLGPGADADIAIYDLDPKSWKPSQYVDLVKSLSNAAYTIKGGEIVVKDGEVISTPQGVTHWVRGKIAEEIEAELEKDLEGEFQKYYSVNLNNYPVGDEYTPLQKAHTANGVGFK